jgi:histidinol-phosphate aminotransferase
MIKYKNSVLNNLDRPVQHIPSVESLIDLSTNVPYDREINNIASSLLINMNLSKYPSPYDSYYAISNFYNVPIDSIAIGYGATEIIERIFKTLDIPHLYIVQPAFEMVEVYCNIYNIPYTFTTDINNIPDNSFVYVSNPNGNNGQIYDLTKLIAASTFIIVDEVYADYYTNYSVLGKNFKNTVIIKSLSKSLGLAGLRFGFSVSSVDIAKMLNKTRSNHIITTTSAVLVPKLLWYIPQVIARLKHAKDFLESTSSCKLPTFGNYVLFNDKNHYTEIFGAKKVGNYYRMALADIHTLTNWSTSHQSSLT